MEELLKTPNLIVHKDGMMNQQKSAIMFGDKESYKIVVFENNTLYDKHHFISSYGLEESAFDKFAETGKVGLSLEKRRVVLDNVQKYIN